MSFENQIFEPSYPLNVAGDMMAIDSANLQSLPAELLAKIFTYYVGSDWSTLDITRGPWVLSHVNHFWRAVALRMPELWSRLIIELDENPAPALFLCQTFLANASVVHLDVQTMFDFDQHPVLAFVLNTFSNRIKTLRLKLPIELLQNLSSWAPHFASLETVDIQVSFDNGGPHNPIPVVDAFALAPQLRNARVINTGFDIDVLLPWQQLFCYSGDLNAFTSQAFEQLWSATNLRTLEVNINVSGPDVRLGKPTVFPYVSQLRLHLEEGANVDGFLQFGTFPTLELLDIRVMENAEFRDMGGFDMNSVVEMVKRSACPLTRLSIVKDEMTGSEVLPLFEHTPELFELNIGGLPSQYPLLEDEEDSSAICGGLGPDALLGLTWSETSGRRFLPKLGILTIHGLFEKEPFIQMLESRAEKQPLMTLCMNVNETRTQEMKEIIAQRGVAAIPTVLVTIVPQVTQSACGRY